MDLAEYESRFKRLNEVFLEENSKLNLSAFRTEEQSWVGNVLDSLSLLDIPLLEENKKLKVLDIGTGGGFPLLPLAICCPDSNFTGLDSTEKKVLAVERIAQELNLSNISVVTGRAEKLGNDPEHREKYDLVLSRAVAPINVLLEYCAPLTKAKGHIVLWKSLKIDQELKDSLLARAELSCHLVKQHEYELPESFGKRQLLVFEKTFKTPDKYPRKTGVPKKNPIA